jgi:stringent starvation protein B
MTDTVSPQRPYLLRAMHEWMTDNGHTPYVVVDASADDVQVPSEYVQDGKIVLNVSYAAVRNLELGNDWLGFEARFAGQAQQVQIPLRGVLGIYARETGRGMIFSAEDELQEQPRPTAAEPVEVVGKDVPAGRPHLKIVK